MRTVMKCEQVQSWMPEYWDEQLSPLQTCHLENHVKQCSGCRQEYEIWEESEKLIRNSSAEFHSEKLQFTISDQIMSRIYAENPWAAPLSVRSTGLSHRIRLWMTGVSAILFIVFLTSLFFTTSMPSASESYGKDIFGSQPIIGIHSVGSAQASDKGEDSAEGQSLYGAVASIGEPALLPEHPGLIGKSYYIALSLFGILITVMGMTWLNRARA